MGVNEEQWWQDVVQVENIDPKMDLDAKNEGLISRLDEILPWVAKPKRYSPFSMFRCKFDLGKLIFRPFHCQTRIPARARFHPCSAWKRRSKPQDNRAVLWIDDMMQKRKDGPTIRRPHA